MSGEPLIEEREVGVQQSAKREVLGEHVLEQHLGLPFHRGWQAQVEIAECVGVGHHVGQVAQLQPLAEEVRG